MARPKVDEGDKEFRCYKILDCRILTTTTATTTITNKLPPTTTTMYKHGETTIFLFLYIFVYMWMVGSGRYGGWWLVFVMAVMVDVAVVAFNNGST